MGKLAVLALLIGASVFGCVSTKTKMDGSGRTPASEPQQLDRDKILKFARTLLELQDEFDGKKYTLLRFPPTAATDLKPADISLVLGRIFEREEIKAGFNIFTPMQPALSPSWGAHMTQRDWARNILTTGLSRPERDRLLAMCFDAPTHVGDFLSIPSLVARFVICGYSGLLHSEAEVLEALVKFPSNPSGVRYDGQLGFHVYTDKALEKQVQILTAALNTHLHRFYELFMHQDVALKEKFRANKEGAAENDKIEPFDLLSTYTTQLIMGKNMGSDTESKTPLNKIQISKLSQKALARMLHIKHENTAAWRDLPNLTVMRSENTVSLMCANGLPEARPVHDPEGFHWNRTDTGTELIETWNPRHDLNELVSRGFMNSEISCNGVKYHFQTEKLSAETIPAPDPVVLAPGQELNALMTVSLVSEIDRNAVSQARALVGLLSGWQAVGEVFPVKTREFLRTELVKADAYFPVMHAMDVNYFNIGTENGLGLRLRKVVKDASGTERVLNLTLVLPDGASSLATVVMKPTDLAQLLHERYKSKPTPLFLMNNSCASEKTLFAWTLVFREALALRKATQGFAGLSSVRDFPHIIGSRRFFGTASLGEIFSHAEYPLRSLEMLGQGKSVREVVEFLKVPASKGFLAQLGGMFGTDDKSFDKTNETTGFEPVYVLDHPELLSLGGFRINVTGPRIRGRDQY